MKPQFDLINIFKKNLRLLSSRLPRFLVTPVLIIAILFMTIPIAHAASMLYAKPIASGAGDCTSWANACTLQSALSAAVSGDQIWVQAGVHKPGTTRTDTFTLKNGVSIYGGFAGTETLLSQRDWQTNLTILSGDIDNNDTNTDGNFIAETPADIQGDNAYHVATGSLTNSSAVLDGFMITAGQANGSSSPSCDGGGMFNQDASPQLTNLIFRGNLSTCAGGGMHNFNSQPLITGVTFINNTSVDGGGMINNHYSDPILINVVFYGNSATNRGGGMANGGDNTDPVLRGVRFENNTAVNSGGGIYNGMYNSTGGLLTDVIFKGNSAADGGGMNNNNVSPTLINGIFQDNSATYGGGIYNYRSAMEIINVTFTGNTALTQGGAMYSWWDRSPGLRNAILWGNNAPDGPEIYNGPLGGTLIFYSDVQGCGGSGAGWNSACGTDNGGNIDADPLFVNAANGNLRLQDTSPAIDAGDNSFVPTNVTTDLDGNPRFVNVPSVPDTGSGTPPIVDLGAYETQIPDTIPPTILSITCAGANPTSADSVEFTVTFSEAVTDVDVTDFSLMTIGVTGASITNINPAVGPATIYTIAVSTGTGNGQLWLEVPTASTIYDLADNQFDDAFTNGEVYDIEKPFLIFLPLVENSAP